MRISCLEPSSVVEIVGRALVLVVIENRYSSCGSSDTWQAYVLVIVSTMFVTSRATTNNNSSKTIIVSLFTVGDERVLVPAQLYIYIYIYIYLHVDIKR